jgi:hypothetical protein
MLPSECRCTEPFFALDASGKSAAHCHHRGYRKARTGKSAAGFFIAKQCYPQKSFKLSNLFHRIFRSLLTVQRTFDTSGKSPAHYHHRENRAEPGRRNPQRAFCLRFSDLMAGLHGRKQHQQQRYDDNRCEM